jgi:long-chain acyl-CoA synthetase
MMMASALLAQEFGSIPDVIAALAREAPDAAALADDAGVTLTWGEFGDQVERVAAALQRDGIAKGDAVAICAFNSVAYAVVWFGILRAGGVVAPLAPSSTTDSLIGMIADSGARHLFLDAAVAAQLGDALAGNERQAIALDGSTAGRALEHWLAPHGTAVAPVTFAPDDAFNIIYSSGTTGTPKGIVQPHAMRWAQIKSLFYVDRPVSILSTPLYSNTTLVSFIPTMANGGCCVIMGKFDVARFLALSERHRVTHAMLVPVQYRRILEHADFDKADLTSFQMKFCTSAPFPPSLKRAVLDRWPGGLVEFYGMTEGGGSTMLMAHLFPDKLHTVGQPIPGHELMVIDEDGAVLAPGNTGEIVGRSGSVMNGYNNQPEKTREAQWVSPTGEVWIRTGDVGRFDEDGFLTLMDRRKDMIISGGFNIYPSDIEAELVRHPAVAECAVVGVPSDAWGETPVAFVVLTADAKVTAATLQAWLNDRVGKTQRLSDLRLIDALPRSPIGKALKRELRDMYQGPV